MTETHSLAVLGLALAIDLFCGEPPAKLHPVVWMGAAISVCKRLAPGRGAGRQFSWGLAVAFGLPVGCGWLAWLALHTLTGEPLAQALLAVFLLTSSFSLRLLGRSALDVAQALESRAQADGLAAARERVGRICSRATSDLEEQDLVATTVESLAENASDSVVAPLFWFALLGVPGAVFYRAVNTLDARIGYRGEYEHLGKAAARLDDVLNYVPARLTALAILAAGGFLGFSAAQGWRIQRRDGKRTPSPNGGAPMAAMAGLLRVRLSKPGVYDLGEEDRALQPQRIHEAWRVVRLASLMIFGLTATSLGVRHVL